MTEIIVLPHIQSAIDSLRQRLGELYALAENLGKQHFDGTRGRIPRGQQGRQGLRRV